MSLVQQSALGSEETAQAVASWRAEQAQRATSMAEQPGRAVASNGTVDITTGIALIALSVALLVGSFLAALSIGGGKYFISVGPLVYGIIRVNRGLQARQATRTK